MVFVAIALIGMGQAVAGPMKTPFNYRDVGCASMTIGAVQSYKEIAFLRRLRDALQQQSAETEKYIAAESPGKLRGFGKLVADVDRQEAAALDRAIKSEVDIASAWQDRHARFCEQQGARHDQSGPK